MFIADAYGHAREDGCIWWASLRDVHDESTTVHYDCRRSSEMCFRWFEGTRHPSSPGSQLIELGSIEEGILIPLISEYLDSSEAITWFRDFTLEQFRTDLIHHGDAPPFRPPVW